MTDAADRVVLVDVEDGVALVTLNRPEARNALSRQLLRELREAVSGLDSEDDVGVIVLTGADPAFCAGVDLKELGADGGVVNDPPPVPSESERAAGRRAVLATDKVVIGAVNGVAVTGGLELALNCDFLVASERARFADTHARVGVQPLWGLTVLLPEAVGLRRAKEMSATGNFVDADTALAWGLVDHVVPHDQLVPTALKLARDVTSSDQRALRHLLETYRQSSLLSGGESWTLEGRRATAFHGGPVDPASVEERRRGVMDRGRSQL